LFYLVTVTQFFSGVFFPNAFSLRPFILEQLNGISIGLFEWPTIRSYKS
jgi:hypothetical protein